MPASPVTGATKREIGKASGETPPPQRVKGRKGMEASAVIPLWPGADAGSSSGAGSQPTNADIMAAMAMMQNAMVGMETRIMTGVQESVKTEVTKQVGAVSNEMKKVKTTVQTLATDMAAMKAKVNDLEEARSSTANATTIPRRKDQILEVVVKGFKEAKDVLMIELENIVKTIMGNTRNIIIDVPDDPCNHGILTFEDNTKKLDFYKKVEEKGDELDDNISFTNKVSWSDRVVEKKLGFIKFHLMAQFKKNVNAVKIYWRKRLVEMDGKKVASYNHENDEWVFYKSAKLVESKVKDSMDLWLSKRETNDPPSESE